jgi:ABC-type branched-subunit amino acid transport system permease subunit
VPKGVTSEPTELVPLTNEQLLATLQATPTKAPEGKTTLPLWVYILLGILVAAAVAALIAWIIMRFIVKRQP